MSSLKISRPTLTALIAFVLAFDLAFAAQRLSGAYRSEFGGHPHEAAHFVNSLFWRDFILWYIRGRFQGNPRSFSAAKAEFSTQWEAHYPPVETGARPSLFTGLEAAWMLAFPATRVSLLILMAGLSAALATLFYLTVRKEFGAAPGGLASALLLLLPIMRGYTAMAMPEVFGAVLVFGAAMLFGELLDCGKKEHSKRWFAVVFREPTKLTGRWVTAGALLLSVLLWQVVFSALREPLYLLMALPAALMFALAGAAWLVNRLTPQAVAGAGQPCLRAGLTALIVLLTFSSAVGKWTSTVNTGFAPLVETLIDDSSSEDVTLVSSDAEGEERFIAQLAVREARPGHTVLCGTRSLGHPGKKGASDEPVLDSDAAMFAFLTSSKIKYIVLDDSMPDKARREHHYQIKRAIDAHLDRFWSIATCPITREGALQTTPVTLYKLREGN